MAKVIDPSLIAASFRDEIRQQVEELPTPLRLAGFLASDYGPSKTYAEYTRRGCEAVGIDFQLHTVDRFDLEKKLVETSQDSSVHGILIYYPVFGGSQDNYIKDQIDYRKDIEGLHTHWIRKLYSNERTDGNGRRSVLPCTPLAIIKLLSAADTSFQGERPLAGKTVTIFNRSEVVGRPLASMLANDGAKVYSFDIEGPIYLEGNKITETDISRKDALAAADIVITGVPTKAFDLIQPDEIHADTIAINFSTLKNFSDEAAEKAKVFIPRVGPMTVTMVLRNTVRLYKNFAAEL